MAKDKITSISGTTDVPGPKAHGVVQPGMVVSLNIKRRQMWKVPGFTLMAGDQPSAQIPVGIHPHVLFKIQEAVSAGVLVVGDKPIHRFDKDIALKDYYIGLLDSITDVKRDLHPEITKLACSNRLMGGFSKREIVEAMLRTEMHGRCRRNVIEYLQYAMDNIPGHGIIQDSIAPKKKPLLHLQGDGGALGAAPDRTMAEEAMKEL